MSLLDILRAPWALHPEKLDELQAIYATHLRGEKIDIEAVEARLGRPLANQEAGYEVLDSGVAVLTLDGVIAPKANLFMRISGGVSAQQAEQAVLTAMEDPAVRGMLTAIDSPGGAVHGTPELAAAMRRFGERKPLASVGTAVMASAAYWVGSAANAVYITGPTVTVGSIGIVARHDYTPNATGGQRTEITAGKYKRIASSDAPLTAEGQAYIQAQVDHLYQVFVDAVAENRGVSAEQVLEHMADGRVFTGNQAVQAGLVDGVATLDQLAAEMAKSPDRFVKRRKAQIVVANPPSKGAGAAPKDTQPVKGKSMSDPITRASLEQDHAPLFAALKGEFMALGAQAERERMAGVRAQVIPGHEALIEQLAADGKTTPAEAAMAVNAAHRTALAAAAAAHAKDAPPAAKPSMTPPGADPKGDGTAGAAKADAKAAAAGIVDIFKRANGG
ncbi:S49 family peptidase [Pseudacidovorax sp. NFM-22]|uniref:S49 family peptidase n=1 Tax=Pseudacidovorax sp. NFM-22 TaxID=2744469 RepID=UPI001F38AAE1|nr:S49 family peptidase [Pseudacidovorax sp. NFM-22]